MYPLHQLTRAVLPQMLERKRGKIVVVGSATSLRGRKGVVAVYGAARGARHGYMKNVAMEVAPYVNINATEQTYVDNITYAPTSIHAKATIDFGPVAGGFAISRIELETEGQVPGIDAATFEQVAQAAKAKCPVSKALAAVEISLVAKLR